MNTEMTELLRGGDLEGLEECTAARIANQSESIPDVLCVDMKMRCMDCLELYKRIHAFLPDTTIIMITIYVIEELVQAILDQRPYKICHESQGLDRVKDFLNNGKLLNGSLLLLADENPASAVNLNKFIETIGRDVTIVHSYEDAVALAQRVTRRIFSL